MQLRIKIYLLSIVLLVGLTGCSKIIRLYPITDKDISYIQQGETAKFSGILMSEFYLNEVLQAKIEAK